MLFTYFVVQGGFSVILVLKHFAFCDHHEAIGRVFPPTVSEMARSVSVLFVLFVSPVSGKKLYISKSSNLCTLIFSISRIFC